MVGKAHLNQLVCVMSMSAAWKISPYLVRGQCSSMQPHLHLPA